MYIVLLVVTSIVMTNCLIAIVNSAWSQGLARSTQKFNDYVAHAMCKDFWDRANWAFSSPEFPTFPPSTLRPHASGPHQRALRMQQVKTAMASVSVVDLAQSLQFWVEKLKQIRERLEMENQPAATEAPSPDVQDTSPPAVEEKPKRRASAVLLPSPDSGSKLRTEVGKDNHELSVVEMVDLSALGSRRLSGAVLPRAVQRTRSASVARRGSATMSPPVSPRMGPSPASLRGEIAAVGGRDSMSDPLLG